MKIALIPRYSDLLNNTLFDYDGYDPLQPYGVDRLGFSVLQEFITKRNHQIATIDQFKFEEIDKYVFIDINYYYLKKIYEKVDDPSIVYMMREPPSVVPFNSIVKLRRYSSLFESILTWNDDLISEHSRFKGYKLPYCIPETNYPDSKDLTNRKLLVNVSSRKDSTHPDELYTDRKRVIRFFDENHPSQFTLFGRGWNSPRSPLEMYSGKFSYEKYRTYAGIVESKMDTYHNHKFSLCFENISNIKGYITEKIFDCFRAGIVPVYYGASNITEYIPKSAFIDYRNFSSPKELYDHLRSMSDEVYLDYILSGRLFLNTTHPFNAENFAQSVCSVLLSTASSSKVASIPDEQYLDEMAHYDRLTYDVNSVNKKEYLNRWIAIAKTNPKRLLKHPELLLNFIKKLLPK